MMTLTAAAHALGVTDKTVHRWALLAEMPLEEDPLDKRVVMIADADVEELRRIHQRDRQSLLDRIAALEARVAALETTRRPYGPVRAGEGNLTGLADTHPSTPVEPPRPRQRLLLRAELPDVEATPEGDVPLSAFAAAHGVNRTSARDHAEAGHFPSYRRDNPARPKEHPHYLTLEGQRLAVAWWREHYEGWQSCPDCPH